MAGFAVEVAQAKLELWLAAKSALASSQSYTITIEGNTRQLSRANLKEVAERIAFWSGQVARAERTASGRGRTRYFVN